METFYGELGFSVNEGKVHEALLEGGKMSASEVSIKSEVSYGKIYQILEKLVNKGFVRIVPGKTKKYVVSDPENLVKIVEKKKKLLEEFKKKTLEMKRKYDEKEEEFFIMAEGDKGFWKVVDEFGGAKKYGYSVKYDYKKEGLGDLDTKSKLKKNVDFKELFRYDNETKKVVKNRMKKRPGIKKFENYGVNFYVADDDRVMINLVNKNVTYLIKDKALAKFMKKMFLEAYKNAGEIKDLK